MIYNSGLRLFSQDSLNNIHHNITRTQFALYKHLKIKSTNYKFMYNIVAFFLTTLEARIHELSFNFEPLETLLEVVSIELVTLEVHPGVE